jgi:hypothetical protein
MSGKQTEIYLKTNDNKCWLDVEKREPLYAIARLIKLYRHFGKFFVVPQKTKTRITI